MTNCTMTPYSLDHEKEVACRCEKILNTLKQHPRSVAFRRPIDLDLSSDCSSEESHDGPLPLDLGTIQARFESKKFYWVKSKKHSRGGFFSRFFSGRTHIPSKQVFDHLSFCKDVRMVFTSSQLYHQKGTDVHDSSLLLAALFEDLWVNAKLPLEPKALSFSVTDSKRTRPQTSPTRPRANTPSKLTRADTLVARRPSADKSGSSHIVTVPSNRILAIGQGDNADYDFEDATTGGDVSTQHDRDTVAEESGYDSDDSYMPPPRVTNSPLPSKQQQVSSPKTNRLAKFWASSKELLHLDGGNKSKAGATEPRVKRRLASFTPLSNTIRRQFEELVNQQQKSSVRQEADLPTPEYVANCFDQQELLNLKQVVAVLTCAEDLMRQEKNIVDVDGVDGSVAVVGDLHGQYFDLRKLVDMVRAGTGMTTAEAIRNSTKGSSSLCSAYSVDSITVDTNNENSKNSKNNTNNINPSLSTASNISETVQPTATPALASNTASTTSSNASTSSALPTSWAKHEAELAAWLPGNSKLLFLGDYVDRGAFSCEVILFLLTLKVNYPDRVILLRGNHECDIVASYFGFKNEAIRKYGRQIYNRCLQCFQAMPIAAKLHTDAGVFLACHGGLSPNIKTLRVIEEVNRFREPGVSGVLCDLLWSDPVKDSDMVFYDDEEDQEQEKEIFRQIDYFRNRTRGCAYRFGFHATEEFLEANQLVGLIRAHEVQKEGFRFHFTAIQQKDRLWDHVVVTVFSAPNYCGRYKNKAALLVLDQAVGNARKPMDVITTVQFKEQTHPVPVVTESDSVRLYMRIEENCPYMPTTVQSFVASALKLGLVYGSAVSRQAGGHDGTSTRSKTDKRGKGPLGKMRRHLYTRAESLQSAKNKLQRATRKIHVVQLMRELRGRGDGFTEFQTAMAADELNEMHPVVVEKKLEGASVRLEKHVEKQQSLGRMSMEEANSKPSPVALAPTAFESAANAGALGSHDIEGKTAVQRVVSPGTAPTVDVILRFDDLIGHLRSTASLVDSERLELEKQALHAAHELDLFPALSGWLTRVSGVHVPQDEEGFRDTLADGVVLCAVVSLMKGNRLEMYHNTPPLSKFQIQENFLEFFQACSRCAVPVTLNEEAHPSEHTVGAYVATLMDLARRLPLKVLAPENPDNSVNTNVLADAPSKTATIPTGCNGSVSQVQKSTQQRCTKGSTGKQLKRPTLLDPSRGLLGDMLDDSDDELYGADGDSEGMNESDNNGTNRFGLNASSLQAMHIHHAASLRILQQLENAAGNSGDEQTITVNHGKEEDDGDDDDDEENESEITFSGVELLTLNLLLMLIDWDGDGKISAKELVMWSRDDVHPLSHATAMECISALDADADGFVGLDDFISFAAQLKEIYEVRMEAKH